jgi:putative endonuclease
MTKEFAVYVLFAPKFDQIYIGCTEDLVDRFHSHNSMSTKGHTIKYRPWYVVHVEFFDTKSMALEREKQLKSSRGRTYVRQDILTQYVGLISVS